MQIKRFKHGDIMVGLRAIIVHSEVSPVYRVLSVTLQSTGNTLN